MKPPSIKRYLRKCTDASELDIALQEEASCFSRCLLMPEDIVKYCWKKLKKRRFYRNRIKTMAIIFNVPKEEMQFRLYELGLVKNSVYLI